MDLREACSAVNLKPSTYYARVAPKSSAPRKRATHPRALSPAERESVLETMNSSRFQDMAPEAIFAALLDEGKYLCSARTMYRILAAENQVRERRNQARKRNYTKPELIATGPNQVWSWDITKLKGPQKGELFYLYVIIDIYSRYVVGWTIAWSENAATAQWLIEETCLRERINPAQLTIHSDRGAPMTAKKLSLLLEELGVTKSLSRAQVSNDNPFSESQFKTMKYRPTFPERFGCFEDAEQHCKQFFRWYNYSHYHSGIAMMTPYVMHSGQAKRVSRERQAVLNAAFNAHPERFAHGRPRVTPLPAAAYINPPAVREAA